MSEGRSKSTRQIRILQLPTLNDEVKKVVVTSSFVFLSFERNGFVENKRLQQKSNSSFDPLMRGVRLRSRMAGENVRLEAQPR